MGFWEAGPVAMDLLIVLTLLGVVAATRRLVPALSRLLVPDAMWAGLAALVLGGTGLGWLPLDPEHLEILVYHALALVFIAVALRSPSGQAGTAGARSVAFAIPVLLSIQGLIGLVVVWLWTVVGADAEPTLGLLLPFAFEQGPGQALSIGAAWEEAFGLEHGGQLGLILAAAGFGWCFVIGVPLLHLARWRGWVQAAPTGRGQGSEEVEPVVPPAAVHGAGLDPLTRQLAVIGIAYLLAYLIVAWLASLLAAQEAVAPMLWGFHFIMAMLVAMGLRQLLVRVPAGEGVLDDDLLTRFAGAVVDVATVAALGAVRIDLVAANLGVIVTVTAIGALGTALTCVWVSRRAFRDEPFPHALVLFGVGTGTLPTGLALLRAHDPELAGPTTADMVVGSALAIPVAAPLLLWALPFVASSVAGGHIGTGVAVLGAYLLAMLVGWRWLGGLRITRPLAALWPGSST